MKKLIPILTILLFLCSNAWGTDYSDGKCIIWEDFIQDFNLTTLVSYSDPLYNVYIHNHVEIIDGEIIIKTFTVDSYELEGKLCDEN